MMGHNVSCVICGKPAQVEENGFDLPAPEDKLCRECRKAVADAREQQEKTRKESK